MNDFLRRTVTRQTPAPWRSAGWGLICCLLSVGLRWLLSPFLGQATPFILFFPAILTAAIFGGALGGLICLGATAVVGAWLFLPAVGLALDNPHAWMAVVVFVVSGIAVVWLAVILRRALQDLQRAKDQEELLAAELQHRVKNTLAIVQALAAQTFQSSADAAAFKKDFTDRLAALAEAHNLLSDVAWNAVTLRRVIEQTLAPFARGGPHRLDIEGEDLFLPPDHVVSLALCLHELATNATKYGALSRADGRVEVTWSAKLNGAGRRVRLTWAEHDGPPVTPPTRKGFGSRLLRQGLSGRARPKVRMEFNPAGVRWTAEFDVEEAVQGLPPGAPKS